MNRQCIYYMNYMNKYIKYGRWLKENILKYSRLFLLFETSEFINYRYMFLINEKGKVYEAI